MQPRGPGVLTDGDRTDACCHACLAQLHETKCLTGAGPAPEIALRIAHSPASTPRA